MKEENPFQIIKPTELPPDNLKKEVVGNVKNIVLILRFIQLFVGDYSHSIYSLFKTQKDNKKDQ